MITLQIHEADFPFVVEAIRNRYESLIDGMSTTANAAISRHALPASTETPKGVPAAPVKALKAKKAPKVSVERLEALEKSAEAPYGLKKDGTPRGKPGRKTS